MPKRRRRLSRALDDMPGLFDNVDIDMTEAENRAAVAAPKAPVSPDASNQDILVNTSVLERPQNCCLCPLVAAAAVIVHM